MAGIAARTSPLLNDWIRDKLISRCRAITAWRQEEAATESAI